MGSQLAQIVTRWPPHRAERAMPATATRGPAPKAVELQVATVDRQGRVRLARIASHMGWTTQSALVLIVQGGVVRLFDVEARPEYLQRGVGIALDARHRVQLPFGIRTALGLDPGTRLILFGVPDDGALAGLPASHLIDQLGAHL